MPKDIESLNKSREIRKKVIEKYGEVPTSVWEIDYDKYSHTIEFDERKQQKIALQKHKKMNYDKTDKELVKAFQVSNQNVRGTNEFSGLSTFPPDLAARIVLFYSEQNDWVLDPFAGHNSRMQITNELHRNYIGYDICEKFMQFNYKIRDYLLGKGEQKVFETNNEIILKQKSSELLDEPDNSMDLIFSSPPYWDVEYYGPEKEQLGFNDTYEVFLQKLQIIMNQCYRVLKTGKYCVMNINDFRRKSIFYTYHSDMITLFKQAGFTMWDIIVIKWPNCIGQCFASQVEERKITAKSHEYLIVGKK